MDTPTVSKEVTGPAFRIPSIRRINFERLRAERFARLQEAMRYHDLPVCLFTTPANIRYATGTDVYTIWSAATTARYCVVPAEGNPVLFEPPEADFFSRQLVRDVRPALYWQYEVREGPAKAKAFGAEIAAVLSELGLSGARVGVDRLDTLGFLALQEEGIEIVDSGPATVDAREVKTADEVELFALNGAIGATMLADFEAAIVPGVQEQELLGVVTDSLLRNGGELIFLRLIASGRNTNPWLQDARDKLVMPGDVVGIDTDAHGYEGYVIDVSRTFFCGERPTKEQRDVYRIAYETLMEMVSLVQPGVSFADFAHRAPKLPERFREQRYAVLAHQVGLEDGDGPYIPHPDKDTPPDREIKENMVMCVECYCGEVGAAFGIKLEEQVLVTRDGPRVLCPYPFERKFLD